MGKREANTFGFAELVPGKKEEIYLQNKVFFFHGDLPWYFLV